MQTVQQKSLGYVLSISVPDSVEEFDRLAKEAGAALKEANKNVTYRSWNPDFRSTFLHGREAGDGVEAIEGLEQLTGIERKTKVIKAEQKDAEGKITQEEVLGYGETEDEYNERVLATLVSRGDFPSLDAARAHYGQVAQSIASGIAFDPSKTERKSAGPKKTPKTYVAVAQEIVKITGSIDAACAAFAKKTGTTPTANTEEALAKAVWDVERARVKSRANEYVS